MRAMPQARLCATAPTGPIRPVPGRGLRRALRRVLCLAAFLAALACSAQPGLAQKAAAESEPQGEAVEISGRVVAGLDKVFIKDAEGFCLVQGIDLTPYSGRNIQAKALVIRKDQEYRTVRLLHYRIQSPDDDSPGADDTVRQTTGPGKKKK
ncbi:hypothetical protein [Humidesulfovibrio idahonensis]